jgi:iron complex outermembrane recepter protein
MARVYARVPHQPHRRSVGGRAVALLVALVWLAALPGGARADAGETPASDLVAYSIEELMQVQVTSVAKAPQRLQDAPAAVYVITAEDIRRSGATSIPELLREVPGMDVARVDGNTWAVNARGFADRYAGSLLVLIDGRSVYSPIFAGVYWDVQDTVLADVDRIEVIRGPGSTLWGANAMAGVVNIITKDAAETLGTYVEAGAGSREPGSVSVRQGTRVGTNGFLRIFAKRDVTGALDPALGVAAHDGARMTRGGFRWDRHGDDDLSVQGQVYGGESDRTMILPSLAPAASTVTPEAADLSGGHVLADWRHRRGAGTFRVKAFVDRTYREDSSGTERTLTHYLEAQHDIPLGQRHRITWGGNVRRDATRTGSTFYLTLDPARTQRWVWGVFVQDRIALGERVDLTAGAKVERNTISELEFQPGVRLLWRPTKRHTVWGAVSHAVQVPSRLRLDGRVNVSVTDGSPPTVTALLGNPKSDEAKVLAFELGYRGRPADRLSLDLAGFLNLYNDLGTWESEPTFLENAPPPTHLVVPAQFDGDMTGETFGAETAATWQATDRVRLGATYAWLKMTLHSDPASTGAGTEAQQEGGSPEQQARLAARVDLPRKVALDGALAVTDQRPGRGVPAYVRLDLRAGWSPAPGLELSLTGQNLLGRHREFDNNVPDPTATRMPRLIYGRLVWTP